MNVSAMKLEGAHSLTPSELEEWRKHVVELKRKGTTHAEIAGLVGVSRSKVSTESRAGGGWRQDFKSETQEIGLNVGKSQQKRIREWLDEYPSNKRRAREGIVEIHLGARRRCAMRSTRTGLRSEETDPRQEAHLDLEDVRVHHAEKVKG